MRSGPIRTKRRVYEVTPNIEIGDQVDLKTVWPGRYTVLYVPDDRLGDGYIVATSSGVAQSATPRVLTVHRDTITVK